MLGLLLIAVIAVIITQALTSTRHSNSLAPPSFNIPFVPAFLCGIIAITRLGADEDGFLQSLRKQYGPVVYLPWPMSQYLALDAACIEQVYRAPSKILSFMPIRREMQNTVFGAGSFWKDKDLMEGQFYKTHARGFQKQRLDKPVERYVTVIQREVDKLAAKLDEMENGETEVPLSKWVTDLFFDASFVGLFGDRVRESSGISAEELRKAFDDFDTSFPLMAAGLLPSFLLNLVPDVKKGKAGGKVLAEALRDWIKDGFPGLEDGVVRDMAQVALDNDLGLEEAGKMLVSDLWALQANAPFIATQLLIFLLQSPQSLLDDIQDEIKQSASESSHPFALDHLSQRLPLLGSCITETLRLGTTSFSIRDVEQPFVLSVSDSQGTKEVVIPPKSRLICGTRVSHLDTSTWGEDANVWDGRRFFDKASAKAEKGEESEEFEKSKRARRVWGFGGGISRCEGSTFATLELKALVSILLSTFDLTLLPPSTPSDLDRIGISGVSDGYRPKRRSGRVGMGAFQFEEDHDLMVRIRRKQSSEAK